MNRKNVGDNKHVLCSCYFSSYSTPSPAPFHFRWLPTPLYFASFFPVILPYPQGTLLIQIATPLFRCPSTTPAFTYVINTTIKYVH